MFEPCQTGEMGQPRRDKHWPKQPTRHVWVQSPEDHQPPDPGVLIEWRKGDHGRWFGLVAVVMERGGAAAVLHRWFDARDLIPVPSDPRSPHAMRWHQGWVQNY